MATANNGRSETSVEATSTTPKAAPTDAKAGTRGANAAGEPTDQASHPEQPVAAPPTPPAAQPPMPASRKWLIAAGIVVGLAVGGYFLVPWVVTSLHTVSTDDAYINGHVTFVAPRVAGQGGRNPCGQGGIGLEAEPARLFRPKKKRRVRSEARPHLEHRFSQVRPDLFRPVGLPIAGRGKELQLAAFVGTVFAHDRLGQRSTRSIYQA